MNMKITSLSLKAPLAVAALALLGTLTLPESAMAKPDKKNGSSSYRSGSKKSKGHNGDHHTDYDQHRSSYYSHPHTSFTLSFGNGYAGRGYYYGPPGVSYYYARPEVHYYRTRELAPRAYWGSSYGSVSLGASVQQALAYRGYYRGSIDGLIGPYSREAIARYQADHGLRPTGLISSSLLRSLDLE